MLKKLRVREVKGFFPKVTVLVSGGDLGFEPT